MNSYELPLTKTRLKVLSCAYKKPIVFNDLKSEKMFADIDFKKDFMKLKTHGFLHNTEKREKYEELQDVPFEITDKGKAAVEQKQEDNRRFRIPVAISICAIVISVVSLVLSIVLR